MRMSLEEARRLADSLWYRHTDSTVIAVVQDASDNEVLMVGSMNREAVIKTLTTGLLHLYSLSRKKLWMKGETSGHIHEVVEVRVDCDNDALIVKVRPHGPTCHTGNRSCFYRTAEEVVQGKT